MVRVEKNGDVLVVSFPEQSKINVTVSQKVKLDITKLIDRPGVKLVIDLGGVTYVDSSGFGVLLSILRTCKGNNSMLRIASTSPDVMELIKLLQLHNVFDFRSSLSEALKDF